MKKDLFNTKEKIDAALAAFKTLINHPGWILLEEILNANIEVVKEQLETGTGDEETKEGIDRLRDKLKVYKEMRDTPKIMIQKLESPEDEIPVIDPFSTVEDLQKEKMEKEKVA